MSKEFEKILRQQVLKEPSKELDHSILSILESAEEKQSKQFSWNSILTYAVAAMLFLSMVFHNYFSNSKNEADHEIAQPLNYIPPSQKLTSGTNEPILNVSTLNSLDSDLQGRVITLDDGRLVRQVIRKTTILKTYYDQKTKVHIKVEEPHFQLFYVPVDIN